MSGIQLQRRRGSKKIRGALLISLATLLATFVVPAVRASASNATAPITVMSIAPVGGVGLYADVFAGVEGAAKDINASGGINGHKLNVVTCNDNNTPTGATQCADQAVSLHVAAVVGDESLYQSSILPILATAHIPSLGSINNSSAEETAPNSFTFTSGTILQVEGGLTDMINRGYNKFALTYYNVPSSGPTVNGAKALIPTLGNKTGRVVAAIPVSPSQTDMSSITSEIQQSGANAVVLLLDSAHDDLILESNYQAGVPATKLPAIDAQVSASDLKTLGVAANGVYTLSNVIPLTSTNYAAVRRVVKDFKAVHYSGPITEYGEQAWAATIAAADAMTKLKVYTPGQLLAAVPNAGTINVGILAPFNWGKPLTSQLPSKDYNPYFVFSIVKNGKVTPLHPTFQNILGLH